MDSLDSMDSNDSMDSIDSIDPIDFVPTVTTCFIRLNATFSSLLLLSSLPYTVLHERGSSKLEG